MRKISHLFLSFSFIISSLSIAQAHTESNDSNKTPTAQEQQLIHQIISEHLEASVADAKKILDEIYNVISGLSMMINDNQIQVANKKDATESLQDLSILIHSLQQEKFMVVDPASAMVLLELNKGLMDHLIKAINNDLKRIPKFDIATIIKRSAKDDPSLELMAEKIYKNSIQLKKLKAAAEVVGLRWYNRAYRTFDKCVIAPTDKYALHKWAIGSAGLGSFALLALWHLDGTKKDNRAVTFLNRVKNEFGDWFLGTRPESYNDIHWEGQGLIGSTESYLRQTITSGYAPLVGGLMAYNWSTIKGLWSHKMRPWMSKKITTLHNTLKGGAYLKRAAQIEKRHEDVTFDDIVGADEVKETFQEVIHFIKDPEYYTRRGLEPPKGILLVGSSRTGKSYSVNALATGIKKTLKSLNRSDEFKYISISAADIAEAGGVEELMRLVRHAARCILFIDEIDLLDLQRKGYNPMLMAFLTNMSGALKNKDPKKQVILIGATTNPENLDKALRQDGRFSKELIFELPTFTERKTYLERKVKKLALSPDFFDLDQIARETEGRAYATLDRLINRAALHACFEGRVINQADLEHVLDKEIRQIVLRDNKQFSDNDKQVIAAHFAGRALMINALGGDEKLAKVTIRPVVCDVKEKMMGAHLWEQTKLGDKENRMEHGALFIYHDNDTTSIQTYQQKIDTCKVILAGFIAEEILLGSSGYDCHKQDIQQAMALVESIAFEGVSVEKLPDALRVEYHRKALQLLEKCKGEVRKTLKAQPEKLTALSDALVKYEILSAQEVALVLSNS